jgi:NADH:ubiquinone oxidoreductase subunit 6 (subunit J)
LENFKLIFTYLFINKQLIPFLFILLLALFASILIFMTSSPVLSLIYFNFHILLNFILLCFFDMSFFGIIFIVVYIGAITIFFIFLIMLIDIRSLQNFSVSYDNLISLSFFGILAVFFFIFLFFFNSLNNLNYQIITESPVNYDFNNFFVDNSMQIIGFLFTTDFFLIILACFLLLICIIIIIIGYKDAEND